MPHTPNFPLPCPWCGSDPGHASVRWNRYFVGCEDDECKVSPQVSGATLEQAWDNWNRRAPIASEMDLAGAGGIK